MISPASHDASAPRVLDAGPSVKPVYTSIDLSSRASDELPGRYPFTRGITEDPQRPLIKFYSGLGTPEQSNRRFARLCDLGVEEIQLATDLPSQLGYDSDHMMAAGEVGRAGVALSSARDMEIMFAGIQLDRLARVGMLGNSIGPIALALFVVLGERQGLPTDAYVVDLQNDPLKEYIARGTQFLEPPAAVKLAADVVEWCAHNAPHWYPLDGCVNHINAAGAGSTRGTAFALSNVIVYLEELIRRGLDIDQVAPLLQMFLDEREDFFAAIANVRATRRVWASVMRDRFGARDPRSMALQVTAYGHGRETRQEPWNNLIRIAMGCLAYRLAGVQTMYSSSYDEAISTPSDEAVTLSVRTQQIVDCEQGFDVTADPLGGSYYVETLTDEIEREIRAELAKIETLGGALACIESGYFRSVITDGAVRRQRWFEDGTRATVGVNCFQAPEAAQAMRPTMPTAPDDDVEERQVARLRAIRIERDGEAVQQCLQAIEAAARADRNVVPAVIDAVRAEATVGEVAGVFRSVYGEWKPDRNFRSRRNARSGCLSPRWDWMGMMSERG